MAICPHKRHLHRFILRTGSRQGIKFCLVSYKSDPSTSHPTKSLKNTLLAIRPVTILFLHMFDKPAFSQIGPLVHLTQYCLCWPKSSIKLSGHNYWNTYFVLRVLSHCGKGCKWVVEHIVPYRQVPGSSPAFPSNKGSLGEGKVKDLSLWPWRLAASLKRLLWPRWTSGQWKEEGSYVRSY